MLSSATQRGGAGKKRVRLRGVQQKDKRQCVQVAARHKKKKFTVRVPTKHWKRFLSEVVEFLSGQGPEQPEKMLKSALL